jgi:hypothetical protein
MRVKYLRTVALLALAGVIGMVSPHRALGENDGNARALEGSWVFQISLQDCNSGTVIGLPFRSLLTFARGGSTTETTSNPMFVPPLQRSPGHGVWKFDGNHTFEATTVAFITLNGALARTQTITQTIEVLTADTLQTTSASVQFYKPDGTLLATGCAVATGTRIELAQQ